MPPPPTRARMSYWAMVRPTKGSLRALNDTSGESRRLRCQHDLADVLARFHQTMRGGRLGQREGPEDDRLDSAGLEQRPDLASECGGDLTLVCHRSRPQRRTRDRQPPPEHTAEIEARALAAHQSNLHE